MPKTHRVELPEHAREALSKGKLREIWIPVTPPPPCKIARDGEGRYTPVGMPWGGADWFCPLGKLADRIVVLEEWRMPRWDGELGAVGVNYHGVFKTRWIELPNHAEVAREHLSREWQPAVTMPEEIARQVLLNARVEVVQLGYPSTESLIAQGFSTNLREHSAEVHLRDQWRAFWSGQYPGHRESEGWAWRIGVSPA